MMVRIASFQGGVSSAIHKEDIPLLQYSLSCHLHLSINTRPYTTAVVT